MTTVPCPQRDSLHRFSVGLLSDEESERISSHLDGCPECQSELLTMSDDGDTLVGQLRAPVDDSCLAEPRLEAAMAEAIAIPRRGAEGRTESCTIAPRVLGEYELLEELGRGGMGRVYRARHTKLDRVVALKILPRGRLEDARSIARFAREMRAIGQLDHPHVVHAYDGREIDEMPVLVMEYVDGMDLGELVRRLGRVEPADACELVRQAAEGLQYAHEHGLVHRDIKPSNMMLTRGGRVKLLDLGLARFYAEPAGDDVTGTGQMMGTADYVAPEQVGDSRAADIRADIYSLGCTLYKLLSGRAPYAGPEYPTALDKMNAHLKDPAPPIGEWVPGLPAGLVAVVERMLAKQPEARFATPAEVVEALRPFAAGADAGRLVTEAEPIQTPPMVDALPHTSRTAPRSEQSLPLIDWARCRCSSGLLVAAGLVISLLGIGFAAGVMITIYKNGQATQIEVPDGSQVAIGATGDVEVTPPATAAAAENDLQKMQGVWQVAAAQDNGRVTPAEAVAGISFLFEGSGYQMREEQSVHEEGTFTLDADVVPREITFAARGDANPTPGIYRLENDRMTIVLNERGRERPREFVSEPNSPNDVLIELRRTDERPQPATEQAPSAQRASALQAKTLDRLKQISLAMWNYMDTTGSFPPAVLEGPDGETQYSWRVALLPYLGHEDLYKQYRRNEPWDSPHNRQLLDEMPNVYRAPQAAADTTDASVYALVGPGTVFPGNGEPIRLLDIIDGTANTILLVEAERSIPWTKPEDIPYDAEQPLPDLGGFFENGFNAVIADGSARFLPADLSEPQLRALISRAGGEVVKSVPETTPRAPEMPRAARNPPPPTPNAPASPADGGSPPRPSAVPRPPESTPAPPGEAQRMVISVDAEGVLRIDGQRHAIDAVSERVGAASKAAAVHVELRIAPELPARQAIELVDRLKQAGAQRVNLAIRQEEAAAEGESREDASEGHERERKTSDRD